VSAREQVVKEPAAAKRNQQAVLLKTIDTFIKAAAK
jgi:hypothetical protein